MDKIKIAKELIALAKELTNKKVAARPRFDQRAYFRGEMKEKGAEKIEPKGTDLEIYTWEEETHGKVRPLAMAFAGKSTKPLWRYYFSNERDRDKRIDETIETRREKIEEKEQKRKEKREFQHTFKEDDILYASWGYDQTNINFYQVTDVKGKMVIIREIASKLDRSNPPADYVSADKNKFIGSPMRKKVQMGFGSDKEGYIKVSHSQYAYKWDGKPLYETSSGWGH